MHTREVRYDGFRRSDGLYELVARLTDVKDADFLLASGWRRRGEAVHDMSLRIAFDAHFTIVEVDAVSDWTPYPGGCDTIGPAYQRLVGLSLLQGFRNAVRDRLGGVLGCTHINELLAGVPTAAIQMRAGEVRDTDAVNGNQPFQLDRCHALATTTETVRRYYPRWYRGTGPGSGSGSNNNNGEHANRREHGDAILDAATTLRRA